jgi:stearoyl-CoA desaturase (Delta-9 desaturase)
MTEGILVAGANLGHRWRMTAVEAARAKGWRHVYFNSLTFGFWAIHVVAIVGVATLGWSWWGLALAGICYVPRLFFVTGAYHRYFSHRSYKTSRWFQFVLALGAQATFQKGALWWAAHHRVHHKESDEPGDLHSAKLDGFWWSHMGWILARDFEDTDYARIKDFAKYPELVWLDKWWYVPALAVAGLTYAIGGWFGFVWAFAVSQVFTWHGTFTINSLTHKFGRRRYATTDESRNHWLLALVTLGEGWHNNHHHYQVACRQGFRWYEVDITYYILRAFSFVGLVWDLHGVPDHIRDAAPIPSQKQDATKLAA